MAQLHLVHTTLAVHTAAYLHNIHWVVVTLGSSSGAVRHVMLEQQEPTCSKTVSNSKKSIVPKMATKTDGHVFRQRGTQL